MVQGFAMGEGRISGVFDYPDDFFNGRDFYCQPWLREGSETEYCDGGLSNVGVLLLNATKQWILGFALTDYEGHFSFDNLPYGTYHVMADLPRYGRGVCEEITLSPNQPFVEGLHLFVNQEGRVSANYKKEELLPAVLNVYPNPSEDRIVISGLRANADCKIVVQNSLGMMVLPEMQVWSNLLGECEIGVADLSSGIYFIQVKEDARIKEAKFVKQ